MGPCLLLLLLEMFKTGLHTVLRSRYLLRNVVKHGSLRPATSQFEGMYRGVCTVLQRILPAEHRV